MALHVLLSSQTPSDVGVLGVPVFAGRVVPRGADVRSGKANSASSTGAAAATSSRTPIAARLTGCRMTQCAKRYHRV